jgi:hypothetical protein
LKSIGGYTKRFCSAVLALWEKDYTAADMEDFPMTLSELFFAVKFEKTTELLYTDQTMIQGELKFHAISKAAEAFKSMELIDDRLCVCPLFTNDKAHILISLARAALTALYSAGH